MTDDDDAVNVILEMAGPHEQCGGGHHEQTCRRCSIDRAIEAVKKDAELLAERRAEQILVMQDDELGRIKAVRREAKEVEAAYLDLHEMFADEGGRGYERGKREENEACARLCDHPQDILRNVEPCTAMNHEEDCHGKDATAIRARISKEGE